MTTHPRGPILILLLTMFFGVCALLLWRTSVFNASHFTVGNPPPDIRRQLLERDIPITSMRPPAIRQTDPVRYGSATSVLAVIEYGDFECQYCRNMHTVISRVLPSYNGKVRFIWRDQPLEDIHPQALNAATFTRCAGFQGKYWQAHDALMETSSLNETNLSSIARLLGLDLKSLDLCRSNPSLITAIRNDEMTALGDGVKTIPITFVGTKGFDTEIDETTLRNAIAEQMSSL